MTEKKEHPESSISVMLVDDDPNIRKLISKHLKHERYEVQSFGNAEDCLKAFKKSPVDIVITDLHLPKMNGIELLSKIKQLKTITEVIIISGDADKDVAINALHQGAFDLFEKPIVMRKISATIQRTVRYQDVMRKCNQLGAQVELMTNREEERWNCFIGNSKVVNDVLAQVDNLQKNDKISVLIRGESGTGKELIAHAIHYGSTRSKKPIVPINCSAIPDELAESMFFGHIKGSFTGATVDRKGCFEEADEGTLFLDEIGDMPPAIQIKLLRILEDEIVMPVGATKGRKVNVRIIAATNSDLEQKVSDGEFREDLYYRLARFAINIPPLRDRKEDIPLLVDFFVAKISGEMGIATPTITDQFHHEMSKRSFAGNVRELRNMVERAMIICSGSELDVEHLYSAGDLIGASSSTPAVGLSDIKIPDDLRDAEVWLIKRAIDRANGNISEAARILGITRAKIYRHV